MKIWVDADACPTPIKEIIYRASHRTKTKAIFIANHPLYLPYSIFLQSVQVAAGFDRADDYILQNVRIMDLVITADIPLANLVIEKNAIALNPRGALYSSDNIKERLAVRNYLDNLRGSGVHTSGPAPLSKKEIQAFSNQIDKFLTRIKI